MDTVRPNGNWEKDPFTAVVEDGKLYGLGSNDTGGSVVAMMAAFLQLAEKKQAYNLVCLESAEEENTGKNGIQRILGFIPFRGDFRMPFSSSYNTIFF